MCLAENELKESQGYEVKPHTVVIQRGSHLCTKIYFHKFKSNLITKELIVEISNTT